MSKWKKWFVCLFRISHLGRTVLSTSSTVRHVLVRLFCIAVNGSWIHRALTIYTSYRDALPGSAPVSAVGIKIIPWHQSIQTSKWSTSTRATLIMMNFPFSSFIWIHFVYVCLLPPYEVRCNFRENIQPVVCFWKWRGLQNILFSIIEECTIYLFTQIYLIVQQNWSIFIKSTYE